MPFQKRCRNVVPCSPTHALLHSPLRLPKRDGAAAAEPVSRSKAASACPGSGAAPAVFPVLRRAGILPDPPDLRAGALYGGTVLRHQRQPPGDPHSGPAGERSSGRGGRRYPAGIGGLGSGLRWTLEHGGESYQSSQCLFYPAETQRYQNLVFSSQTPAMEATETSAPGVTTRRSTPR